MSNFTRAKTFQAFTLAKAADVNANWTALETFLNITGLTDSNIQAGAAINLSKLASLTASQAVVTTAAGVLSTVAVLPSELLNVAGSTSNLQTQINSIVTSGIPSSNFVNKGDLLVGLGASTLTNVPAGSNGYVLTASSSANQYVITCSSANATVGATYTDSSSQTFTVLATISSATSLYASGPGTPAGTTLTKASGTGDSTITFSASTNQATGIKWSSVQSTFTAPTVTKYTSTGTTSGYLFPITASTSPSTPTVTAGTTYGNNGHVYTALNSLAAAGTLYTSGTGAPLLSGGTYTLSKISGPSGDSSTLTYTPATTQPLATYTPPTGPSPLYIRARLVGGGGGGAGGSSNALNGGAGSAGKDSVIFDATSLNPLVAHGGSGASAGDSASGAGGSASLGSITSGYGWSGGRGCDGSQGAGSYVSGGSGGASIFGGAGGGGAVSVGISAGSAAAANTGSGGGGGGSSNGSGGAVSGGGGGAGAAIDVILSSPSTTYYYCIGAAGSGGSSGTGGGAGGNAAAGIAIFEEHYQ